MKFELKKLLSGVSLRYLQQKDFETEHESKHKH